MRRLAEEMVLGPWFRKVEGTQRWAQGLLVACGRGLLTLPSIKTLSPFLTQKKTLELAGELLYCPGPAFPGPRASRAAAPLPKSLREGLCAAEEPRGRSRASAPFRSAGLNASEKSRATWEERKTGPFGESKRSEN